MKRMISFEFNDEDDYERMHKIVHSEDYAIAIFTFWQWLFDQIDEQDKEEYCPVFDKLNEILTYHDIMHVIQ